MSHSRTRRARRMALVLATIAGGVTFIAARAPEQARTGQEVYASTCAACHQAQGEGTEMYPPLAESEYVTGDEARLVRIILHGLTGEIEVAGQTFSGMMPGWGAMLSDAELSAVATYVRASFGNRAGPVTAAMVAQLRAAHAARTTPWTVAELARVIPVTKP